MTVICYCCIIGCEDTPNHHNRDETCKYGSSNLPSGMEEIKMKKHEHNWTAISKKAEVVVEGRCVFVCHCGERKRVKIDVPLQW